MSVVNLPKSRNYVSIANTLARDARLSYEARGLMLYLLSHVGEWKVSAADIEKQGNIGPDKRRKIYRELEEAGYLRAERPRGNDGRVGFQIDAFEEPLPEHQRTCLLGAGARQNRSVEKPDSGEAGTRQSATHKKDMSSRKTDLTENQGNNQFLEYQKKGEAHGKTAVARTPQQAPPFEDFSENSDALEPLKREIGKACGIRKSPDFRTDDQLSTQAHILKAQGVTPEQIREAVKANPTKPYKLKFFAEDILALHAATRRADEPEPEADHWTACGARDCIAGTVRKYRADGGYEDSRCPDCKGKGRVTLRVRQRQNAEAVRRPVTDQTLSF